MINAACLALAHEVFWLHSAMKSFFGHHLEPVHLPFVAISGVVNIG